MVGEESGEGVKGEGWKKGRKGVREGEREGGRKERRGATERGHI